MTSRLRVAHFGTGHTGTQVLRQILQRPDLDPSAPWFTRRKESTPPSSARSAHRRSPTSTVLPLNADRRRRGVTKEAKSDDPTRYKR